MPLDPHAADSPVEWTEWGPDAFRRAREEDKPILLRISAVWCHWCHVMDETTDSDEEVARRMNEWFVPVRVDNDERPDVNARYNLGGWPTTAFLTPDGDLITGGTYFPAPQFREILERIHQAWKDDREALAREVERIRQRREEARVGGERATSLDADGITASIEAALDAYDWRHGGFGTEPKFPQPEAIRLLLHAWAGSGAEAPREAAEKTLIGMRTAGQAEGRTYGLYDHAAGGFFRYSTRRDWSEPHFEKMCEDNARLALGYLDAWRLTGEEIYEGTVRGVLGFVLSILSDKDGGAYGSQDADGEAEYYGKPLPERAEMPTPYIDRRFYTNWNGMMIVAAIEASAALDWTDPGGWAVRTVDRLHGALTTEAGAMRHVLRPESGDEAIDESAPLLLGDQVWWLRAELAAFQSTGGPEHRDRAASLANVLEDAFFDADRGALRDRSGGTGEGALDDPTFPLADNATAAIGLADLAALGEDARWRERAEEILASTRRDAEQHGVHGAGWALAATRILDDPIRVHLVGERDDPDLRTLWRTAWRRYAPTRVTELLDPDRDGDRLGELGYPTDGRANAYVCVDERCLEPAADPETLDARLDEVLPATSTDSGS